MKYSEIYNTLPQKLQDAISSVDTSEAIEAVHQKHKLHIDQLEPLENLTLDVLYGIVKPNEFTTKVEEALSVGKEDAASITIDINSLVFQPVRDALMSLNQGATSVLADRDEILREIANPTPVPISGRRYATADFSGALDDGGENALGSKASSPEEEALLPDTNSGSLASNPELEARLPNADTEKAPASIVDTKANSVITTETTQAAPAVVDPYLEPVE